MHAGRRSHEKAGADKGFELGDLPAHGALRQRQLAPGAREAADAHDGFEHDEGIERRQPAAENHGQVEGLCGDVLRTLMISLG